jgi:hypothetical protein
MCKIIKIILKSKINSVKLHIIHYLYYFIKDMLYLLYKIIKYNLIFEEIVIYLFRISIYH